MKRRWIYWVSMGLLAAICLGAGALYGRRRESNDSMSVNTMNEIQGVGRLKIHDGNLEEFKHVASQFMQVVRTKDAGTLQYELYFNSDQTECLVLEKYRDVQSLLEHQKNVSGLMDALLKTCTVSSVVCGTATPELVKALGGSPVPLFSPYLTL
jgi:quinol monooxygenase YgiN